MSRGPKARAGFSLIEMLVVIAIMGILASVALPLTELAQQRAKEEELRRALRQIRSAIDRYKELVDLGAIARAADASGYPPNLDVLASGVPDPKSLSGGKVFLLRSLPRDPFASPDLPSAQTWSPRSYASPPEDPKPGKDVFDVHSMSRVVGLNGQPYNTW